MGLKHVEMKERMDLNIRINRQTPGIHMNFSPFLRQKAIFIK